MIKPSALESTRAASPSSEVTLPDEMPSNNRGIRGDHSNGAPNNLKKQRYQQALHNRDQALAATGKGQKHRGGYKARRNSSSKSSQVTGSSIDPKLCDICKMDSHKYKCSRPGCTTRYCSVACNKTHKENHAPDPEPAPVIPPLPPVQDLTEKAAGKSNPFRVLMHSEHLQYLFKKYPRLPKLLLEIYATTESSTDSRSRIPAALMKNLPDYQAHQEWDREKAITSGRRALRKARDQKNIDGEAIREYSELVLYLMDETGYKTGTRRNQPSKS